MKTCTKCRKTKSLEEFPKRKRYRDGIGSWCRSCCKKVDQKWAANNPEKTRAYVKKYRKANPGKVNKRNQDWRKANPAKVKEWKWASNLKAQFGLTPEDYQEILDEQGGGCKICGKTARQNKKRLAVDHVQKPWQIRGILCNSCNRGLGCFRDDLTLLSRAIEYLQEAAH